MYPTVPLSSSPSKEAFVPDDQALFTSPFFWSCERTADEIARHMTDAILSAEHTLTPRVEIVSSEPPLTILHNFLSPSDIEAILKATQAQEMQRSTMGATQQQAEGRTSSTAWLADSCCQGPLRRLADKTSRTVQLHSSHMENLQVVRYSPGQEFTLHTDHLDSFNDLECRGRLATCLIYLQPPPKEEARRAFQNLKWTSPVSVSAVFFFQHTRASGNGRICPEMFLNVDLKMRHAELPVLEGEKGKLS